MQMCLFFSLYVQTITVEKTKQKKTWKTLLFMLHQDKFVINVIFITTCLYKSMYKLFAVCIKSQTFNYLVSENRLSGVLSAEKL